jgi:hypothetical protein
VEELLLDLEYSGDGKDISRKGAKLAKKKKIKS